MIAPSPAPKRPRPRRWPFVLAAMLLAVGGAVLAGVLLLPDFVRGRVHAAVVTKLEALTGQPVSIGQVQVNYGQVRMSDIRIGAPQAPLITLNRVEVSVDRDALWDRKVVVRQAVLQGGLVNGDRQALEDLAKRIRKRDRPGPARSAGRVRIIPDRIQIEALTVDVRGLNEQPESRIVGRIDATVWPPERIVDIEINDLHLNDGGGRVVHAAGVAVRTQLTRSPMAPTFPLRVQFKGMGTQLTEHIAIAGTDGFVEIADADATRVRMDLEGGF